MKTLRVCLSSELPVEGERLPNFIYFTYDKLILYIGAEKNTTNYAISDTMPENPVPNMLYILSSDGSVHQYLDYSDNTIATIEDPEQIENIRKAGTTYFVNSESRYIDKHDRTLVMPFNGETYELVVNYNDEDKFDNDTIVKYNEDTGQFELYSGAEKYTEYSKILKGKKTASVDTQINGSRITAYVNISQAFGNALRSLSDGLFVRGDNKVSKEEFDEYYKEFKDLRSYCYSILDNLDAQVEYLSQIISKEGIEQEIHNQLEAQFTDIEAALDNYDYIRSQLDVIESNTMSYATNTLNTAIGDIDSGLQHASSWDDVSEDVSDYTHEVDYYQRARAWENELSLRQKRILIGAALMSYYMVEEDPDYFKDVEIEIEDPNTGESTTLTQTQIELILAAATSAYIKSTEG